MKAAADIKLYDLEKHAKQIDVDKHEYNNSSENTDDNFSPRTDENSSQRADENSSQTADDNDDDDTQQTKVTHMQLPTVSEKYHVKHDDNTL